MDYLYLTRENATSGAIFVDEVRVWREDDPAQVNILREPNANSHLYFDPMSSAQWDLFIFCDAGIFKQLVQYCCRIGIGSTRRSTAVGLCNLRGSFSTLLPFACGDFCCPVNYSFLNLIEYVLLGGIFSMHYRYILFK